MWFEVVRKTLETGKTLPLETGRTRTTWFDFGLSTAQQDKINFDTLPAL